MPDVSDAIRVRDFLLATGRTQAELAADLGVVPSVVCEWVKGFRTLTRWQVAAFCRRYKMSPAYFAGDKATAAGRGG
jgi:hypothetical protein